MVPMTVPGGLDTNISWRRKKFGDFVIVIDIVIWADLEAAAAGEAAWLAPERSVKMYNLLPRRVCDVHVKTPDVSNIDVDWWSDF